MQKRSIYNCRLLQGSLIELSRFTPEKITTFVCLSQDVQNLSCLKTVKKKKIKKNYLISNSCNTENQSKQCIFSLSSVIRVQITLCGLFVNFQEHTCQLERGCSCPTVTLPTAEKRCYSRGHTAKETFHVYQNIGK